MKLIRVPMEVGGYVGGPGVEEMALSFKPPQHARVAVLGLLIDNATALLNHEVLSIKHGGIEAVVPSIVSGTRYGVPLAHVASALQFRNLADEGFNSELKIQPWPGRYNDRDDWTRLFRAYQEGVKLSQAELLRLRLAGAVPCEKFALWPLTPEVTFTIDLKRIVGSTAITAAELLCVEFDGTEQDVYTFDLLCSLADLTDYPQWMAQALVMQAAAGVLDPVELRWVNEGIRPHAFRVSHLLAHGVSNNGGTLAYAADHAEAVSLLLKAAGGARIVPSYADRRVKLSHQAPQLLQQLDCWRRFDYVFKWSNTMHIEAAKTATTYIANVRLTFYGLLRPQTTSGDVPDAA